MATTLSDAHYHEFAQFLLKRLGIVLGDNKQYLVKSRLMTAMREYESDDINAFIKLAISERDKKLTQLALESMTTNETFWFRDEYPYHILTNTLLPALAEKPSLKIWSSACSYGQEPYSIAMVVSEFQKQRPGLFKQGVNIVASDISQKVLNHAKRGLYDELAIARGLPERMQSAYFTRDSAHRLSVNDAIKKMVSFKQINLTNSLSMLGQFDIIFCRNVLIYFDKDMKAKILQNLSALLPIGGALLLGAAESISGAEDTLKMTKCTRGLYYTRYK